jgi:hypothetical protein
LALSQEQLNALAKHGAQSRINELRQEIAAIEHAFPQLRARRGGRPRKQASATEPSAPANQSSPARRRSRGWSASQRKAAADRMKAYWAKRKAGRKK